MKCPNCKAEMKEGALANNGNIWTDDFRGPLGKISFLGGDPVTAYKCPKCGKVELTTKK